MTEAEIIIVMFCIVAGIVFFGVLLGSIAEALTVRAGRPCAHMHAAPLSGCPSLLQEARAPHALQRCGSVTLASACVHLEQALCP